MWIALAAGAVVLASAALTRSARRRARALEGTGKHLRMIIRYQSVENQAMRVQIDCYGVPRPRFTPPDAGLDLDLVGGERPVPHSPSRFDHLMLDGYDPAPVEVSF